MSLMSKRIRTILSLEYKPLLDFRMEERVAAVVNPPAPSFPTGVRIVYPAVLSPVVKAHRVRNVGPDKFFRFREERYNRVGTRAHADNRVSPETTGVIPVDPGVVVVVGFEVCPLEYRAGYIPKRPALGTLVTEAPGRARTWRLGSFRRDIPTHPRSYRRRYPCRRFRGRAECTSRTPPWPDRTL
jgi:hypothetical protein